MVNFEKGKIYTIRSHKTDLIYVGSTVQPLYKRLDQHKRGYNKFVKCNKKYCSSYEIFKLDDEPYIELVINYPCSCKDELHKEEGKYIRKIKCVNKRVAGRTLKEYDEDNKVMLKEKKKEYYEDNKADINKKVKEYYKQNKEEIKEKMKEYREKNKEHFKEKNKEYWEKNKEMLKIKNKEYYEKHKKVMLEKASQKVKCPQCDKEITKCYIKKHIKNLH